MTIKVYEYNNENEAIRLSNVEIFAGAYSEFILLSENYEANTVVTQMYTFSLTKTGTGCKQSTRLYLEVFVFIITKLAFFHETILRICQKKIIPLFA